MKSAFSKAGGTLAIMAATLLASTAAAQTAPPLSAYGELPDFEDADLSPEGDLALLANVKGKRLLIVLDENMKATNSMEVGDMKVRGIDWVGDDAILLTRSDTQELGDRFIGDKAEFFNVMIVPAAANGAEVETIFGNDKKMLNSIQGRYGMRKIDGRWVGFYGGVEMARNQAGTYYVNNWDTALYSVDLLTNKFKKVANPGSSNVARSWLLDENGEISATFDWIATSGNWELENAEGKTLATGNHPRGRAGVVAYTPDGSAIVYSKTDSDGDIVWHSVPVEGGESTEYLSDKEVDYFYTKDGRIIGYGVDDETPTFFDANKQSVVEKIKKAFVGKDTVIREWTPDFKRVLVSTKGNRDSGTWYIVDMDSMQARPLGSERPQIPPAMVGQISTVEYTAGDGLELDGILTLPPGREAKDLPVIMLPHGGPHAHDTERFDWWAQGMASRGYAVFQPNFRGSTNKDRAFYEMSYGNWGTSMQTDISDGLNALAEKGIVDPDRACIVGASYGGYAALAGVTLQNDIYKCAVSVAGVSDIAMLYSTEKNESGKSRLVKESRLEEFGPQEIHRSISPRWSAEKADAPIMLIHGRDDTVVLYRQSTKMADALKDAGKPFEFVELEGEDHWLSKSETRQRMLTETVAFIEKHNPAD